MLDEPDVAEVGHVRGTGANYMDATHDTLRCEAGALALAGVRANLAGICGLEVADFWLARI